MFKNLLIKLRLIKLQKYMDNISEHITYEEAIRSATANKYAIENVPNEEQLANMRQVAEKCFEPIRAWVGNKLYISSFFRSAALNAKVGGKSSSNHLSGCAIDIDMDAYGGKTNREVYLWAKEHLDYDECFLENGENGWVHIAYRSEETNRHKSGIISKE